MAQGVFKQAKMMNSLSDWMQEYGEYEAYALILCDFNPFQARQILNNCSYTEIAEAVIARNLYNKQQS